MRATILAHLCDAYGAVPPSLSMRLVLRNAPLVLTLTSGASARASIDGPSSPRHAPRTTSVTVLTALAMLEAKKTSGKTPVLHAATPVDSGLRGSGDGDASFEASVDARADAADAGPTNP